jgi:uncharacterized protein (TIGR02246 family)
MALTPADVIEIAKLCSSYNFAVDDGDGETFASLFVPDGVLDLGGEPVEGRAALAEFARRVGSTRPGLRHVVANVDPDGDGDEATLRAYVTVYQRVDGQIGVATVGRYHDSLRRAEGAWRFVQRTFTPMP